MKNPFGPSKDRFYSKDIPYVVRELPKRGTHKVPTVDIYYSTEQPLREVGSCANSNSFWCGAISFENKFAMADLRIVKDECSLGIQFTSDNKSTIRIPPVQVYWRNPKCQLPKINPPPLPDADLSIPPFVPDIEADYYVITGDEYTYEQGLRRGTPPQAWSEVIAKKYIHSLEFSIENGFVYDTEYYQEWYFNGTYIAAFWTEAILQSWLETDTKVVKQGESLLSFDSEYLQIYKDRKKGSTRDQKLVPHVNVVSGGRENLLNYLNANTFIRNKVRIRTEDIDTGSYNASHFPFIIPGRHGGTINKEGSAIDFYGEYYYGVGRGLRINLDRAKIDIFAIKDAKKPPPSPPPPPPSPPKHCCMSCCPDNNNDNLEQLLRLILKKIGASDLPATVPKVLTDRSKGTMKIETLAQFSSYGVKQLDAVCGKYPIEIDIKDSDLTKEGDQTKKIKIPNLAEGIAEALGLLLQVQSETSAALNAAVRTLIEASSIKHTAIITHDYAKANAEFLGYKGDQELREVLFMCSPGEKRLDETLKECTLNVKGWENVDEQDIKALMAPLLDMAAMYRTQNFRNLGTQDTLGMLTNVLKSPQLAGLIDALIKNQKIDDFNKKDPENQDPEELKKILENNFDKFTEEAENGFISKAGIKDNANPYGRPYDERPRIREIGNSTGE